MFKQILALAGLILSLSANAALYDRGNGMIYDDELDITWLQDIQFSRTSGYDSNGRMTFDESKTWAEQLSYKGYNDWRLPSVGSGRFTGRTSRGELGHMYFRTFDLYDDDFLEDPTFEDGETGEIKSFINPYGSYFWYREGGAGTAYMFRHGLTWHAQHGQFEANAWAVRDGDVSAVPVPATAWLFGSAIVGLIGFKRKK